LATGNPSNKETVSAISPLDSGTALSLPPAVVPSYIPAGYTLDNIEVANNHGVTISYLPVDNQNQNPLIISITPDLALIDNSKIAPPSPAGSPTKTEAAPRMLAVNPVSSDELTAGEGTWDGNKYLITSNQPLKKDEMTNLVNSLLPRP